MKKKIEKIEKPCSKDICIWCNKKYDCEWWHKSVNHNMPFGWMGSLEDDDKELKYHLGYLWNNLKLAFSNKEFSLLNPGATYMKKYLDSLVRK